MKPLPPIPTADAYDHQITARSIVVSYLLVAAIPVALWAVSEPVSAVTVATVAAAVAAVRRHLQRRRDSVEPRHVCLPHTSVCVEV